MITGLQRLFISLFLWVAGCLFLMSLILDWLWSQSRSPVDTEQQISIQLSQLLATQISNTADPAKFIEDYQSHSLVPVAIKGSQAFALPKDDQFALDEGRSVTLYEADNDMLILTKVPYSDSLLVLGPISQPIEESGLEVGLVLSLYASLALVLFIWLKPLWRDLMQLQSASESFAKTGKKIQLNINERAPLFQIAEAFRLMSLRINGLLETQKSLSHAVSHELRTPIARVKFGVELLPEQFNDEKKAINADLREMEQLVDEMLQYAQMDHQQPPMSIQKVDIAELINNLSSKSNADVRLLIPPELPCFCDGHMIERVLTNLIHNAEKYGKGMIRIHGSASDKAVTISVEDNGPGISDDAKVEVFKPFERGEQSRNKKTGGYGLGLAIVAKIIQWHQGTVWVEDSELGGCKLVFRLDNQEADTTSAS